MIKAPDKIYIDTKKDIGAWFQIAGMGHVEYIRADIVARHREALEKMLSISPLWLPHEDDVCEEWRDEANALYAAKLMIEKALEAT